MPLVVKDRVKETTTTTGTGTITLAGAVTGFQAFSVIGDGNTTYYTIAGVGSSEFEVGVGTYTLSGTTLSRDTILESSNSGSAVSFSAGSKEVFVTYPAERAVYTDAAGTAITPATSSRLDFSNLAQGSARSVLGVTGNATADNASIVAGTDHQVLRRSGTAVAFGAVNLAQSAAVTGTLPVGNGGTDQTSYTNGQLLIGNTTGNTLTKATLTQGTGISVTNGTGSITIAATNNGDVVGPASATDNAVARYDGTTGKLIQNSVVVVNDTGAVSGVTQLDVDNVRIDGNTISSTNTNGNIELDPDGSGAINIVGPVTAGGTAAFLLKNIVYETTGTSATYTTPTGVRALYVEVVGGGGGGGGCDGQGSGTAAASRSGGGGGYVGKFITSVSASYTFTIGAGGTGGAAGDNNGTAGSNTTFTDGTLTLTAGGGGAGSGSTGTSGNSSAVPGGLGGTATGGDVNLRGSRATSRSITSGDMAALSAPGCAAFFGGGNTSAGERNADNATNFGEGGGGASAQDVATNFSGGNGGAGVIRITEYF